MFALSKKVKFTMMVAAATTAVFMVSCGGKATTAAPTASGSAAPQPVQSGFVTVTTPATELEELKRQLEDQGIPAGIGIGMSSQERIARSMSADQARAELATSIGAQVQRLSESYAQDVNGKAKSIWEEAVRTLTNEHLKGTNVYKSVTQQNAEGQYQIYSLMILNPSIFKASIQAAMEREEEFELRVKKDDMMSKLDANIAEYDSKYKR